MLENYQSKELDKVQDGLEYLIGKDNVSIRELMNNKFIVENTDFDNWDNLLRAAGVKNENDLENQSFNQFINTHSHFDDLEEMLQQAASQYAKNHLSE
jgi:hypothetical protein